MGPDPRLELTIGFAAPAKNRISTGLLDRRYNGRRDCRPGYVYNLFLEIGLDIGNS